MFVVHGGLPRSGTVLVGTIVRAILHGTGTGFTRTGPLERRHLPNYAQVIRTRPALPVTLSHTHLIDADCTQALRERRDAVVFWNHREPRDVLVSLMTLHDLTLQHALKALDVYLQSEREMAKHAFVQRVCYEDLVKDRVAHISRIGAALGMPLTPDTVTAVAAQTSASRHRAVMRDVRAGTYPHQRAVPTLHRPLQEDPDTLINDRHIQSGEAGRWRNELTPEQARIATEHLAPWIEELGYPVGSE